MFNIARKLKSDRNQTLSRYRELASESLNGKTNFEINFTNTLFW